MIAHSTLWQAMQSFVGAEPQRIFASVVEMPTESSRLKCHTCVPNGKNHQLPQPLRLLKCGGAGLDVQASQLSALGEGLERYAASRFALTAEARSCCHEDLASAAVPPTAWQVYSPEQYADADFAPAPLTSRSVVKWYRARKIPGDEPCWVPGPLSVFAYRRAAGERRHFATTSTGLALAANLDEARLAGLLEVIERDCVTLAWTWRMPVREVAPLDPNLRAIIAELGLRGGDRPRLFNIANETRIPVFLAIIEFSRRGQNFISLGSAARLHAAAAARKALLEAAQGMSYVQVLKHRLATNLVDDFSTVTSFERGAAFYNVFPQRLHMLRRRYGDLLHVAGQCALACALDVADALPATAESSLDWLCFRLRQYGHEAYYIDVTPPDLAAAGLAVVRALIPALYSLEGNHALRVKNDNRAEALARRGGWQPHYNDYPHPLP